MRISVSEAFIYNIFEGGNGANMVKLWLTAIYYRDECQDTGCTRINNCQGMPC